MNKWLFAVVAALFVSAIANNFYTFYIKKDYDFTVEAPCDPAKQVCYIRDCSDGSCPPNNLSEYRVFHLNAADFDKCQDDSCLSECLSGSVGCNEDKCVESEESTCTQPPQVQ